MKIVGCDLHTRYQQMAMLDRETGELVERRLEHESGEARAFYAALSGPVQVGIEATGHTRWFERMLARAGARALDRRCGTDPGLGGAQAEDGCARCGAHTGVAVSEAFSPDLAADAGGTRSAAVSLASAESWCGCAMRSAINCTRWPWARVCAARRSCSRQEGARRVGGLGLGIWASYRRQELLTMLDQLDASLHELDQAVAKQPRNRMRWQRVLLMTHPGVGPVTSLAFVLTSGTGGALRTQQAGGELSGTESARALFGRAAAAGRDLEARQSDDALVVGRGRTHGGAIGPATAARVSAVEVPSWGSRWRRLPSPASWP
jgi:transposase